MLYCMKKLYTFEQLAQQYGINEERIPFLKEIYSSYCYDIVALRNKIKQLNLDSVEAIFIFTYVGAVIAGQAAAL